MHTTPDIYDACVREIVGMLDELTPKHLRAALNNATIVIAVHRNEKSSQAFITSLRQAVQNQRKEMYHD